MDVQKYINQMKDFYTDFLDFLENENENDFPHCLQKMKNIIINHDELKSLLHLIIKVSKNHHRFFLFDQKIEQILSYLSNPIKNAIHNIELFKISRKNKTLFKTMNLLMSNLMNFMIILLCAKTISLKYYYMMIL